jgi:hypothetical protein
MQRFDFPPAVETFLPLGHGISAGREKASPQAPEDRGGR